MATLTITHSMVPTQQTIVKDGVVVQKGYFADDHDHAAIVAECMTGHALGETKGQCGPVGTWYVGDDSVTRPAYSWSYETFDMAVVKCRDRANAQEWADAIGGRVRAFGTRRNVGCPGDDMVVSVTDYEVMSDAAGKARYDRAIAATAKMPAGPARKAKRLELCRG